MLKAGQGEQISLGGQWKDEGFDQIRRMTRHRGGGWFSLNQLKGFLLQLGHVGSAKAGAKVKA